MMEGSDLNTKIEEFDILMKSMLEKKKKCKDIMVDFANKLKSSEILYKELKSREALTFYVRELSDFAVEDMLQYVKYWGKLDFLKYQTLIIEVTIEEVGGRELAHRLVTSSKNEIIAEMHRRTEHATKFMEKYKMDNPLDTYFEDILMVVQLLKIRYGCVIPDLEINVVPSRRNIKRAENILDYLKTMFDFDK